MSPPKTSPKSRLDQELVRRGLVVSRARAQALILAGKVLVNDEPSLKAGDLVHEADSIRLRGEDHPYVSRAALKLKKALEVFGVSPEGRQCLDVGASTGGFTEILLLGGATRVFAIDVGHSQMDWKIRSDSRVVCIEGVNARHLKPDQIGAPIDLGVIDVSFISLVKILPAIVPLLHEASDLVTLIKPQFEVGRDSVGKGGIVKDMDAVQKAIDGVREAGEALGLRWMGLIDSPILGTQGNREFLAHWKPSSNATHLKV